MQSCDLGLAFTFSGRLCKQLVKRIAADVTCYHHVETRYVEKCRVVCVRVSGLDDVELVTFQVDNVARA
jgi:hypothetical protein